MEKASRRVGDRVVFKTNTGTPSRGRIVQVIKEKKKPDLLLIERPEDQWRVFRLESEVSSVDSP